MSALQLPKQILCVLLWEEENRSPQSDLYLLHLATTAEQNWRVLGSSRRKEMHHKVYPNHQLLCKVRRKKA